MLAGRGFGKTRSAGEWVRSRVERGARHIIVAGPTAGDARDAMVEGESGLLAISPPWDRPHYEPSKSRLTWKSGARALVLSADEPDRFRNKQCDTFWADELAAWKYPDAWDQLQFGFRLGAGYIEPRGVVSTTPRPTPIIRKLIKGAGTAATRGSTYENRANLSDAYFAQVVAPYEGTRLGRQELHAELLDDVEGALWSGDLIERSRIPPEREPQWRRIVVAIDPAVTATAQSDETGIVVVGLGEDGHGYVIGDYSGRHSPDAWARIAVKALDDWRADRIVAEANNGGALVEVNLRTVRPGLPIKLVHASKGKRTRAEPVAALYEQGKVHHIGGFPKLEDQLTTWEPFASGRSPDRLDALVWGLTELMLGAQNQTRYGLSVLDYGT